MTQVDGARAGGMSRRDLLRRGAVVGATAAWTVPLVQVVSMTPAHADSPSAPPVNPPPITTPVNPPPTSPVNPPPTSPVKPPPTSATPPAPSTHSAPPDQPSSAHRVATAAPVRVAGGGSPSADASALANTGVTFPVAPTLGVGAAAIALGAGALSAAHALTKRQESTPDA
jgi:hypothetical protein